jgi:hypothetical protein
LSSERSEIWGSADINPTKPLTREPFVFFLDNAIEATGDYPMIKIFISITITVHEETPESG